MPQPLPQSALPCHVALLTLNSACSSLPAEGSAWTALYGNEAPVLVPDADAKPQSADKAEGGCWAFSYRRLFQLDSLCNQSWS